MLGGFTQVGEVSVVVLHFGAAQYLGSRLYKGAKALSSFAAYFFKAFPAFFVVGRYRKMGD